MKKEEGSVADGSRRGEAKKGGRSREVSITVFCTGRTYPRSWEGATDLVAARTRLEVDVR